MARQTEEHRAKIAEAQRRRWAEYKKQQEQKPNKVENKPILNIGATPKAMGEETHSPPNTGLGRINSALRDQALATGH